VGSRFYLHLTLSSLLFYRCVKQGSGHCLVPGGRRGTVPQQEAEVQSQEWEESSSTVEKECLAIKWAVGYYLLGRAFNLCPDHAPLRRGGGELAVGRDGLRPQSGGGDMWYEGGHGLVSAGETRGGRAANS